MKTNKPLDGVIVVELATFVAAPISARLLSDWGATVIKVESINGDPMRRVGELVYMPTTDDMNPAFDNMNGLKQSIIVNLKEKEGIDIVKKLISKAHIFITNYRSTALSDLGLDYITLKSQFPNLIYAHILGFGENGPDKDKPGFDFTAYYARGGVSGTLSEKDTPPLNAVQSFGDVQAGAYLSSGILAALYEQEKTGKGNYVSVSLYNTAIYNMGYLISASQFGFNYPISRYENPNPLQGSYKTKDNRWVQLAIALYDREFPKLCRAINYENLIEDETYSSFAIVKNNPRKVIEKLDEIFISKTADEWCDILYKLDLPCEKIMYWNEISEDIQAWENGYLEKVDYGTEDVVFVKSPVKFGESEEISFNKGPKKGENTQELLRFAGYDQEGIGILMENNIVK